MRGISSDVVTQTREAAKNRGVSQVAWVEAALLEALVTPETRHQRFLKEYACRQRKLFLAHVGAGFTEEQALELVGKAYPIHLAQVAA